MYELKTKENEQSVNEFLQMIEQDKKRNDCFELLKFIGKVTGKNAKMWGNSIIGFGSYQYKYPSGQEGEWFLTGFAPRKTNISIYIIYGIDQYSELLEKLGKFKRGKSCLYINKIEDIDLKVLEELIKKSIDALLNSELIKIWFSVSFNKPKQFKRKKHFIFLVHLIFHLHSVTNTIKISFVLTVSPHDIHIFVLVSESVSN